MCVCTYVCMWARIVQSVAKSLWGKRSADRIPVGARFSAPIQNGTGAYSATYAMDIVSFPGVNWPLHGVDQPLLSSAEVKERVDIYIYSPMGINGLF